MNFGLPFQKILQNKFFWTVLKNKLSKIWDIL